jgi:hypothetical protein
VDSGSRAYSLTHQEAVERREIRLRPRTTVTQGLWRPVIPLASRPLRHPYCMITATHPHSILVLSLATQHWNSKFPTVKHEQAGSEIFAAALHGRLREHTACLHSHCTAGPPCFWFCMLCCTCTQPRSLCLSESKAGPAELFLLVIADQSSSICRLLLCNSPYRLCSNARFHASSQNEAFRSNHADNRAKHHMPTHTPHIDESAARLTCVWCTGSRSGQTGAAGGPPWTRLTSIRDEVRAGLHTAWNHRFTPPRVGGPLGNVWSRRPILDAASTLSVLQTPCGGLPTSDVLR